MRMMRSKMEIGVKVPRAGYHQEIFPGMDVDFDRVLAAAVTVRPAKGKPGDDDYQPAVEKDLPAITLADALGVHGADPTKFEPVPADPPAKAPASKAKE